MVKIPHINKVSIKRKDAIKDNFQEAFAMEKRLTPVQLAMLFLLYNLQNIKLPTSKQKLYPDKANLGYCNMINKNIAKKLKRSEKYVCEQIGVLKKVGILHVVRNYKVHYKRLENISIQCLTAPFQKGNTLPVYKEGLNTLPKTLPQTLPETLPETLPVYKDTLPVYKRNKKEIEEDATQVSYIPSSSSFFNFFLSFFERQCSTDWTKKLDVKILQAKEIEVQYIEESIKKDTYYKGIAETTQLEATLYKQFDTITANAKVLQSIEATKKEKEQKELIMYGRTVVGYLANYKEYIKQIGYTLETKNKEAIKAYAMEMYKQGTKINFNSAPDKQISKLALLFALVESYTQDQANIFIMQLSKASLSLSYYDFCKKQEETPALKAV